MGGQYAAQINQQLPIINDPEANRYINLLGDSIARLTSRTDIPDWKFFIVDSREVNAFAVPGGYIYVNRGLIERTQKMDQLAGVLGHEIGHVVKRHSIKQMQQAQGANMGVTLACFTRQRNGRRLVRAMRFISGQLRTTARTMVQKPATPSLRKKAPIPSSFSTARSCGFFRIRRSELTTIHPRSPANRNTTGSGVFLPQKS